MMLKASKVLFKASKRSFCASQQNKDSKWPEKPTDGTITNLLKEVPLADEFGKRAEVYPRRPFPKDKEVFQIFEFDKEEKGRLPLSKIGYIMYSPPSIYALYSLMNLDLYNLSSKMILLIGFGASFGYLKKLKNLREKEAQSIYITQGYKEVYIELKETTENNPLFEQELPEELKKTSKKFVKIELKNILFWGYSDILSYIADGYSKKDAEKKVTGVREKQIGRMAKSPLVGTIDEIRKKDKKSISLVAFHQPSSSYLTLEAISMLNLLDDKMDYIENVANGKKSKFFGDKIKEESKTNL